MSNEIVEAPVGQMALRASSIGMTIDPDHVSLVPQNLGEVVAFAQLMSRAGPAVPPHLREQPGACLAVAMRAFHLGMEPFALADKTYFVNDRMAFEAQAIAAIVLNRVARKGMPRYTYEGEGPTRKCRVEITMPDGEVVPWDSPPIAQINPKRSPLWLSDQDQQLGYYSIRGWARRHRPDVIMGIYDREEAAVTDDGDKVTSFESLEARAAAAAPGAPPPRSAPAAEVDSPTAASATPASGASAEATSSPNAPAAASGAGAKDEERLARMPSGYGAGLEVADGDVGEGQSPASSAGSPVIDEGSAAEASQAPELPLGHEATQPAQASPAAPPAGAFGDYAESLASARDWPEIEHAIVSLARSPEYGPASTAQKSMARRLAFVRLKELTDAGYRFDFITNLQAWRCYIEWEMDKTALDGNRRAVALSQAWADLDRQPGDLGTRSKIALDNAYADRMAVLNAEVKLFE
jgi:hypothetical protein